VSSLLENLPDKQPWYPTLRKEREGWATRGFVAGTNNPRVSSLRKHDPMKAVSAPVRDIGKALTVVLSRTNNKRLGLFQCFSNRSLLKTGTKP